MCVLYGVGLEVAADLHLAQLPLGVGTRIAEHHARKGDGPTPATRPAPLHRHTFLPTTSTTATTTTTTVTATAATATATAAAPGANAAAAAPRPPCVHQAADDKRFRLLGGVKL